MKKYGFLSAALIIKIPITTTHKDNMNKQRNELGQTIEQIQEEAEKNGLTQEILNDIINK